MWRTCGGRHLAEAEAISNHDPMALKVAEVYQRLCTSPHIISGVHAAKVLLDRAAALNLQGGGAVSTEMKAIVATLTDLVERVADSQSPGVESEAGIITALFIDAVVALYASYDDFDRDLFSQGDSARRTASLWSSYRIAGSKHVTFIQEDYLRVVNFSKIFSLGSAQQRSRLLLTNDGRVSSG